MIDNKGKIFGKISLVDLLIVLLVVVAVGATVYKFGFSAHSDVNESNIKIEYVLKVEGVREYTVNSMEIGQKLFDSKTEKHIGDITNIKTEPAKDHILMVNGNVKEAQIPERYDVYLTVESDARMIGGSYYANGHREINKYGNIELQSQNFSCASEVQVVGEVK